MPRARSCRAPCRGTTSAGSSRASGRLDAAARSQLPGVSEGRARQLYAGALVAEAALDLLQVEQLDICPWALREGLILRHLDHLTS